MVSGSQIIIERIEAVAEQVRVGQEKILEQQKSSAEQIIETQNEILAKLDELASWDKASIAGALKAVLASSGLKMPQLAMPVRVLVAGRAQTPSIDAVLELLGRETVLARLARHLP